MASSLVQKADKIEPRAVELTLAHSPDSDDAFMFYALATKKIGAPRPFVHSPPRGH